MTTVWWIRNDLRLRDNAALSWAAQAGPVVALFVLAEGVGEREMGAASRWWLHKSLEQLGKKVPLVLKRGDARVIVPQVMADTGAKGVAWNRSYEPMAVKRDTELKGMVQEMGLAARTFNGALLHEPLTLRNKSGEPFQVFTPFWKHCRGLEVGEPLPIPQVEWVRGLKGDKLDDWRLLPVRPNWAARFEREWAPGEDGAQARLRDFVHHRLCGYAEGRDRPDLDTTSRLSPHLHFGEISVREVYVRVRDQMDKKQVARVAESGHEPRWEDIDKFLSEIGWREFSAHLLYHYPRMIMDNWKAEFDAYPWIDNEDWLVAWQRGKTGYPLVDAGMRELWATGYMHNRVRMVVASFLVKHLRTHWRLGEEWFWDTLVDGDTANNVCGWQWVTGCGADAAPYFRIFNPIEQSRAYDPQGAYIRRWVPELAGLSAASIHTPWEASPTELSRAGVILGETYPYPIVQHAEARAAALQGWERVRGKEESH